MPKASGSKTSRKGKGRAVKTPQPSASPPVAQEPPAKKARKTASSSSASSKGKRAGSGKGKAKDSQQERGQLWNIFERLSLDAIYTVFSHLHPTDLLRVARTSRLLRSHLMSKSSTAVWKEARLKAERQVPECPLDQSEPQWAYLLYTRDCSCCDKTNIAKIDWYHRVRLCRKCSFSGKIMVLRRNAAKALPHVKDLFAVLDLMPYWKTSPSHHEMYYPINAIEELATRYAVIKAQGNQEKLEEFKEQMLTQRKAIVESVERFKEWEEGLSVADANRNVVYEKFEALGYLPIDIGDHLVTNSLLRARL
ncbi:hypothetical protein M407DRAFT_20372 [Tulasnella calospora MUT 4182]|uniref:F-box domain-containing protein n=1 Tax=Tulasnella calospora MUT 4182 TaxID=1051891 RepID=A0A0C3MAE2_9AGAM|nr:hypothetical protein M407DRAFT_20372 [Tulasnella calospora MUT 4182]